MNVSFLRGVLGVALIALGSVSMVLMLESFAFAYNGTADTCSDDGCTGRGGDPSSCGSSGGCTENGSYTCTCKEDPTDDTKCYCKAS